MCPICIPSPSRLQPIGPPRFLCDVMAEGLARQLRLCGFDTGEGTRRHRRWFQGVGSCRVLQITRHPCLLLLLCFLCVSQPAHACLPLPSCRVAATDNGEGAASRHLPVCICVQALVGLGSGWQGLAAARAAAPPSAPLPHAMPAPPQGCLQKPCLTSLPDLSLLPHRSLEAPWLSGRRRSSGWYLRGIAHS